MIKSMTGFGKATVLLPGKKITAEIKSLNSKQLDLNLKIPSLYREKEPEIRQLISQTLERGKIDFYLSIENTGSDLPLSINKAVAANYYHELKALAEEIGEAPTDYLSLILRLPDVMKSEMDEVNDDEWKMVQDCINQAIVNNNQFRLSEGKSLDADFHKRVQVILNLLNQVEPFEEERMTLMREKLKSTFEKYADEHQADSNRFEQELIFYFEKLDITEEKVRLKKHCDYFTETLNSKQSEGKKLGFITQEMGREINTLGSKANHAQMQRVVVQMKDELEKIKEQVNNVL